ncbi:MAG TPA: UDP-N-acetylglucosamine--dolichyl-phosphate N-acetylglucosaminephosphotransferase, partial [Candidatus Micrarchaeota archaeon]|nr:UDP-N-acetylglucosamine--dolichyl-phosphate N-acetylglucosaminephosphotransferase [Candidatus Micrarchaeota archaeon]
SSRVLMLPFIGPVEFGVLYPLILIPLAITVSSNLTNMLAGFNGLEAGMGIAMFAAASLIAYMRGAPDILIFTVPMMGALIAFLYFNKFPARIFIGDVGTLSIGATLAAAVIIGGFQSLGAFLVALYVLDFVIKAYNRFPSKKWWGENRNGKLYPVEGKVRGLAQLVMKLANGITEQGLVMALIGAQALVGIAAVVVFIVLRQ